MRSLRLTILIGILLPATVIGRNLPADVRYEPDDADLLHALAEGYLSNREALTFFKCRFHLTEGTAASIEDAMNGVLLGSVISNGIWVVDGDRFLFQLECDQSLLEEAFRDGPKHELTVGSGDSAKSMVGVSLPCDPHGFLTNGGIQLRYGGAIRSANIRTSDMPLPGVTMTPFSFGIMGENESLSPGRLLKNGFPGLYEYAWLEDPEPTDDGDLITIAIGWGPRESNNVRRRLYLDPNRGCLPVRCFTYYKEADLRETQGERISALFLTDVIECSNDRWFPQRGVVIRDPDSESPPYRVKIIHVQELDADHPPDDSDLVLTMPSGTSVADPTDLRSGFRLREDRQVGPQELQPLLAEAHTVLEQRLANETLRPPIARAARSFRSFLVILNLCVVPVIAFIWWRARNRRRTVPDP